LKYKYYKIIILKGYTIENDGIIQLWKYSKIAWATWSLSTWKKERQIGRSLQKAIGQMSNIKMQELLENKLVYSLAAHHLYWLKNIVYFFLDASPLLIFVAN
jgi:hypothetical protein